MLLGFDAFKRAARVAGLRGNIEMQVKGGCPFGRASRAHVAQSRSRTSAMKVYCLLVLCRASSRLVQIEERYEGVLLPSHYPIHLRPGMVFEMTTVSERRIDRDVVH